MPRRVRPCRGIQAQQPAADHHRVAALAAAPASVDLGHVAENCDARQILAGTGMMKGSDPVAMSRPVISHRPDERASTSCSPVDPRHRLDGAARIALSSYQAASLDDDMPERLFARQHGEENMRL